MVDVDESRCMLYSVVVCLCDAQCIFWNDGFAIHDSR